METFDYKKYAWMAGTLALVGIFFSSLALGFAEWKSLKYPNGQVASITVVGEGEVTAVPDIATVMITVRESAKTVPEAQQLAEAKVKATIAALNKLGVEEKDVKTLSYYINPKYENVSVGVTTMMYPVPVANQRTIGYEVSQTVEIKVRKVDSAGEVVGALGSANITELSGPSFIVDDPDELQAQAKEKAIAQAKEKAIAQAKEKAKATARALGADLGPILGFNDDNGYYPMYARDSMLYGKGGAAEAPSATLPQGENIIKSRVTITYSLD